ncbi:MAG TPA: hypothetical protein VFO25_08765 [Candidatus Eremiobacteraceae bacterium]|nr:hypothetical protein [Candidatus Eremiobacteraceae bacterium]
MTGRAAILGVIRSVLLGCARSTHPTTLPATPLPTPASSPTRCWILDRMYPMTELWLDEKKVTPSERHEIEMWANRVSPDQRSLVRWIRDPRDKAIYIFVAEPEKPGTISDWIALNANVAIDVHRCWLPAVPGA